jgi:hypothetical protein
VDPQKRSGRREEQILDPTGIRSVSPLVQPVASPYTDSAIPPPLISLSVCLSANLPIYSPSVGTLAAFFQFIKLYSQ